MVKTISHIQSYNNIKEGNFFTTCVFQVTFSSLIIKIFKILPKLRYPQYCNNYLCFMYTIKFFNNRTRSIYLCNNDHYITECFSIKQDNDSVFFVNFFILCLTASVVNKIATGCHKNYGYREFTKKQFLKLD